MAYELKQELKLTQGLVMTPQLQLAIKLLQLSRLELLETIREEVQTNPVMEDVAGDNGVQSSAEERATPEAAAPEQDWESYMEHRGDYGGARLDFSRPEEEDDDRMAAYSSTSGGLAEHLLWQFRVGGATPETIGVAEYIIGNIADDGYLKLFDAEGKSDEEVERACIDEISASCGVPVEFAQVVLSSVQALDPPGVGARTLRECLLVQARQLPVRDTVAEEIIWSHLALLARRNYKAIAKELGVLTDEVVDAARMINGCLNPTPGAGFGADDAKAVVPDVFITRVGEEYVITLNDDGLPKLKISRHYREMLKSPGTLGTEAREYIQGKMRSAMWLIKSVHQRQKTIYRVVECIVRFQREFLDNGLQFLKPMVLRDVSAEIGVHESTVSRVTSNKYVQTPRGVFELKYFFSTGMASSDGTDLATEYIKEKLREIIKAEDPKNPMSDIRLVDELKKLGIVVARRTAAKYREVLGIQPSSRRRSAY